MDNKRLLIAVALSAIILFGYEYFFAPKVDKKSIDKVESKELKIKPETSNIKSTSEHNKLKNIKSSSVDDTKDIKIISTITNGNHELNIDSKGRIYSYKINNINGKPPVDIINHSGISYPLELLFADDKLNKMSKDINYVSDKRVINIKDSSKLVLIQNLKDLIVTKTITFYKNGSYKLNLKLSKKVKYYISVGNEPMVGDFNMTIKEAVLYKTDDKLELIENGDAVEKYYHGVKIASLSNRYYTSALFSKTEPFIVAVHPYNNDEDDDIPSLYISSDNVNLKINGYIGEKSYDRMKAINKDLLNIIDYGYFTIIAKPIFLILNYIHNYIGNWGWAIILFTILIRIVLYPITHKGMISMQKMKDLSPKIKEIQTKFKGDSAQMQSHMMGLYKKNKVNPIGGCLPLLLQIPIFFSIYRVLIYSVELSGAPWILWVNDLSAKDPFYILPILMGISMYIQQKVTPNNFKDPMQQKIFSYLPLVFVVISINFPAGLTLYWTINNTLSILQQLMISRSMKKVVLVND